MQTLTKAQLAERERLLREDPDLVKAQESGPTIGEATSGQIVGMAGSRQFSRLSHHHPPGKGKAASAKGGSSELVVRPEIDTPNSPELQALAERIKVERDAFERTSIESAQHIVRLGELLEEARATIRHGGWLKWIETNTGISKSTAYNYMELTAATRSGAIDLPTVGSLGLKAALKLIAKPKAEPTTAVSMIEPATHQPVAAPSLPAQDLADLKASWTAASPQAREEFRRRIEPVTSAPAFMVEAEATAEPNIFARAFGPLSGAEWYDLVDSIRAGRYKRAPLPDCLLKLLQHHNVPLAELEAAA